MIVELNMSLTDLRKFCNVTVKNSKMIWGQNAVLKNCFWGLCM